MLVCGSLLLSGPLRSGPGLTLHLTWRILEGDVKLGQPRSEVAFLDQLSQTPSPSGRVEYSPIIDRPPIRWPNGARIAVWVSPNIEHYEFLPPPPRFGKSYARTPLPDVMTYASRDYGNRVGFWRMLEVLDKWDVKCTVSLNVGVLDHFPEIRDAMVERDWDYMSHGIYNTTYLSGTPEEEERAFYRDTIASVLNHTGKQMKGMLGPALTNTERTPDLMAEAGMLYHADWFHDDQPFPLKVAAGRLISLPYSIELNDVMVKLQNQEAEYFTQIIKDQFDVLYQEGAESGRVMCIALHPFWVGQPQRIRPFDDALAYIRSHDKVWLATAGEITEFYMEHHYDEVVAHLQKSDSTN